MLGAGELEWHHAADGTRLCIHRWVATGRTKGHLLVVHGYADHAGRYAELASYLASSGFAVVAPDLRGHGRSEGPPLDRVEALSDWLKHIAEPGRIPIVS